VTSITQEPRLARVLDATDMWASLAIVVMWLAVLFDAVFGPDIVSTSSAGGSSTSVPSAVAVALFALIATTQVAKYGFGRERR
jgi:hypothetical protein